MNKNRGILVLAVLCLSICSAQAEEKSTVRIAVLPFEAFTMEKKAELGNDVAVKLAGQLRSNPAILTPDFKAVQTVVRESDYALLSEERLKELARVLDANFIVLGSVTRLRQEYSIDVQMFNTIAGAEYLKTFAEGAELDVLIEEIANKLTAEVFAKAELIPPSQQSRTVAEARTDRADEAQVPGRELDVAKELGLDEGPEGRPAEMPLSPGTRPGQQAMTPAAELAQAQPAAQRVEPEEHAALQDQDNATTKGKRSGQKASRDSFSFDKPIKIHADSMEYDNKQNRALFNGNVVARQGDVTMFADTMEVLYGDKGKLNQFAAIGNVKVIQGDRIATGQRIIFHNDEQKIVATGNPRVWQGDNVINGYKITVYLKEDRYVVESSPENRASASIYPQKKKP
jgi:lipopolysaccharide export system protein LptA